jgi:hypothetical protein
LACSLADWPFLLPLLMLGFAPSFTGSTLFGAATSEVFIGASFAGLSWLQRNTVNG